MPEAAMKSGNQEPGWGRAKPSPTRILRPDPHHVIYWIDEDLAFPGLARLGKIAYRIDDAICILIQ